MITVVVYINGNPIFARSARNISNDCRDIQDYKCDDGTLIKHNYKKGFVPLAQTMLDTVHEEEITSTRS